MVVGKRRQAGNGGGIENKADELIVLNTDNILRTGMSANPNMLQIDCEEVNRIACLACSR